MHLSKSQQFKFWSDWKKACTIQGWTKPAGWSPAQIENERYSLLRRAGFDSLTEVDHLEGFDRVLAELAAIIQPNSIDAQLRQQDQPIHRLKHAIALLAPGNNYLKAVMRDKFSTDDWDTLSLDQLTQLRNTLAARRSARRRKEVSAKIVSDTIPF